MSPSMYSVNFGSNRFAGTIAPAPIPRSAARKYCRMLLPVRAAPAAEVSARATEAAAIPTLLQAIGVTTEVAIVGAVQKLWITGGTGGVPEIAHTWNFSSDRFLPEPLGFHRANCVEAAAAAPTMLPAAMVVDQAVRRSEKMFPLAACS